MANLKKAPRISKDISGGPEGKWPRGDMHMSSEWVLGPDHWGSRPHLAWDRFQFRMNLELKRTSLLALV